MEVDKGVAVEGKRVWYLKEVVETLVTAVAAVHLVAILV